MYTYTFDHCKDLSNKMYTYAKLLRLTCPAQGLCRAPEEQEACARGGVSISAHLPGYGAGLTVSACRWITFQPPSSRRYTWVARKVYVRGSPFTETEVCSSPAV